MGVRLIDVVANDKVHEGRKEGGLQALGRNRSAVKGVMEGRRRLAAQAGYEG